MDFDVFCVAMNWLPSQYCHPLPPTHSSLLSFCDSFFDIIKLYFTFSNLPPPPLPPPLLLHIAYPLHLHQSDKQNQIVKMLCGMNIKKYIFDTLFNYWKRRIGAASAETLDQWYGEDPLLRNSSVELLALRETMALSGRFVTTIARLRDASSDTRWLLSPSDEEVESVLAHGVPAFDVRWPNIGTAKKAVLLYFHGGGYLAGFADAYVGFLGRISKETEIPTLSVDYRLCVPGETTVTDCVDDALSAYRHLCESYEPSRIVLCGDSAGAGLVVSLLQRIMAIGGKLPACGVCISPFMDAQFTGESCVENTADLILNKPIIAACREYLAEAHDGNLNTDPVSPMYGKFRGLPPLWISTSTKEAIYTDAIRLYNCAKEEKVDVTLRAAKGYGFHGEPCLSEMYPEAKDAFNAMCEYINKKLE